MPRLNLILLLFALLNIFLGIYGYFEAKSLPSLMGGVGIGALMLGSVALAKTHPRWGRIASLLIAAAVVGQFLPKFLKTQKWLPAGVLAITSIVVIVALLAGHIMANRAKKA